VKIPKGEYYDKARIFLNNVRHQRQSMMLFTFVWRILEILHNHPEGITQTRVMEYSRTNHSRLKLILAFMERKHLIHREWVHRNHAVIFVTDAGEECLEGYRTIKHHFR